MLDITETNQRVLLHRARSKVRREFERYLEEATADGPPEMSCQEIVELVTDYLEGALSSTDRKRFEAHLGNCPHCTRTSSSSARRSG